MSEIRPVFVTLNTGSGHGDATAFKQEIRAGFDAPGIRNALQGMVSRTPEACK
jgi:hypothetical protein